MALTFTHTQTGTHTHTQSYTDIHTTHARQMVQNHRQKKNIINNIILFENRCAVHQKS